MIISEMNVKLTASTAGFSVAMDKAGARTKKFSAGVKKVGAGLRSMAKGVGVAALALAAIAWPTKKLFDLGAGIAETGSKFNTVFGPEASAEVSAFLDNFANKAGLTTNEAKGLVATTGSIAQGLGFSQKASGKFATEITKLAGDLSSFNNIPTEEVLMGINSALTGEREQMKRLGIVILEADVQSKAFAQTGKTVAKTLTQQEKATATLALITEKAGVAVGDLDRTQGSAANVAKRLVSRFKEIRDAIATALMPAFKHILEGMEKNEEKFIAMKTWLTENTALISAWAVVFIESLKTIAMSVIYMWRWLKNTAEILMNLIRIASSFISLDFDTVGEEWEKLKGNLDDLAVAGDNVSGQWAAMGGFIKTAMEGGKKAALETVGAMGGIGLAVDKGKGSLEKLTTAAETLDTQLKTMSQSFASDFVSRMTSAVQGGKNAFSGFFTFMKNKLIEMAMKFLLFQALMGISAGKLGGIATELTGFSAGVSASDLPNPIRPTNNRMFPTIGKIARGGGGRSSQMVVNQNINFTVSAIDGKSASVFMREQGGTIADIVAQAAKDSTSFRRQLQGA